MLPDNIKATACAGVKLKLGWTVTFPVVLVGYGKFLEPQKAANDE